MPQFTNEQAKEIFNAAIAKMTDPDQIAKAEVAREYFTNPDFRKALQDCLWERAPAYELDQQCHI
jgi:hypothetical protein